MGLAVLRLWGSVKVLGRTHLVFTSMDRKKKFIRKRVERNAVGGGKV